MNKVKKYYYSMSAYTDMKRTQLLEEADRALANLVIYYR